jgi:DNA repair exonuclease SbcCD ATPase subunit
MKDFAKKMTKKAKSGIDSAGSFLSDLPIIGDYQNKERRRDADRKLRESIAVSLETARKRIIEIERLLLRKGKLTDLPYVDVAANRLQTLIDRIHTAPSGYAGFFDREAIREPELEKLHQFDERIAASVPEINEKINTMEQCINAGEDYSQALTDLINSLDDLSERMDQRKEAIRSVGEEVAAIAEISETPPSGTPTTPPDDSFVD